VASVQIDLPDKLVPIFEGPARFRCAYGGRGSAKTRTFAKMSAVIGAKAAAEGRSGIILCGRQFMNSLADSSFSEIAAAIRSEPWLQEAYEIGETFIRTRDRRVEYSFVGLARNLSSIKSKALIILCWIDEAEDVSEEAWVTLVPTVREDGSEIWVTWNPKLKKSATDMRFRNATDPDIKVAEMNWRDNPWFPSVLERERERDLRDRPEQYDHIWEGGYATVAAGAYFATDLLRAKQENRICRLAPDPLLPISSYHDIGGAGAKADAYSIWITQKVSREIRVLNHYTARGQPLAHHVMWMRENGYGKAEIVLPHDGLNTNNVSGKTYEDHWREAGFNARSIPNQGAGAAKQRIEAVRRLFPRIWFNDETTGDGRISLGWYHPKISDDERRRDMGPDHDWSSHDADAFGLMAIDYLEPSAKAIRPRDMWDDGGSGEVNWRTA
jgi:phage terminase large subunit